jgi:light-regulated signal transduction histidine kinase (bacteriophytochrome)
LDITRGKKAAHILLNDAFLHEQTDPRSESCKEYVRIAYDNVFIMNNLIEALLKSSCSTHGDLLRETINLSEIAKSVVAEMRLTAPNRRGTFKIAEGLLASGDPNLLRSVLENLIGNAWKYTGALEEAIIEFGATEIDGNQAYFVRDNGTGFDMGDAEKLFARAAVGGYGPNGSRAKERSSISP